MIWSLTKLKIFEQCPAKYKFRYIDRMPEKKSQAAQRGTDKHKIVEDFLKGDTTPLPHDLSFYNQFLTGLREKGVQSEHKIALNALWEPTDWDSPTVWYRGVLDALLVHEPTATYWDWKSGKIYDDHDEQREIYAVAVSATHPTLSEVRGIHVYLDLGQNRETNYSVHQMPASRDRWTKRAKALEREVNWIPHPNYGCRWCPFSKAAGGPCRF